ncbi:zinc-ribbon domain-containing protein [Psychrobacillus sp. NPDC058041]|uniref:zinc ribbon domain-containing protein n=1 Tax=Psychrobacillus sp. NPDC058041 TaxID=3346310 RepID=UPI0036DF7FB7
MKFIAPFVLFIGIAGLGFSVYDFFTSNRWEGPEYFWLGFVALPVIFVGFILTGIAYRSKIIKSNEEILRAQMRAVGQGLKEGLSDSGHYCSNCGHQYERDAKFCSECGNLLEDPKS